MTKVLITDSHLDDIADAIRGKLGVQTEYKPGQMAAAIASIPGPSTLVSKSITANGEYDPADDDADGYSSVTVAVSGGATLITKNITENGTYNASSDNADGYSSVTVDVPNDWRDTFSVNWDFSNPVNTRGSSSYGGSNLIYTLDGWQLQGGKLSFVTGGIKLERYASGTAGFFMQRYNSTPTSAMVGKTFTLSGMVDGVVASQTAAIPSANSGTSGVNISGVNFRIWNYGAQIAVTIDISSDTGSHVIQAIKLEAGSNQTLASQVNGVWVLNNSMDTDTEYIKARMGVVFVA